MKRNEKLTPWHRVFAKFGLSQNALAKELGWHRSKISRCLSGEINQGHIRGSDLEELKIVAKRLKVELKPEDLTPVLK